MGSNARSALGRAVADLTEGVQAILGTALGTGSPRCRLVDELLGPERERRERHDGRGRGRTPPPLPRRRRPARRHLALVR